MCKQILIVIIYFAPIITYTQNDYEIFDNGNILYEEKKFEEAKNKYLNLYQRGIISKINNNY